MGRLHQTGPLRRRHTLTLRDALRAIHDPAVVRGLLPLSQRHQRGIHPCPAHPYAPLYAGNDPYRPETPPRSRHQPQTGPVRGWACRFSGMTIPPTREEARQMPELTGSFGY
ncbi:hypothetical protein GCM10010234_79180 [Streptomyces hawaiiensis]